MHLTCPSVKHTSASLCLNENADPDVRVDMEMGLNNIVPETLPYVHDAEGSDDMVRRVIVSVVIAFILAISIEHSQHFTLD